MNSVNLIGNVTHDIEMKPIGNGRNVVNFTLAVRNPFKNEGVDFIRCSAFGKAAELLNSYVKKGQKIAVEGRVSTSSYTDKDGNSRTSMDILLTQFHFIESKNQKPEDFIDKEPEETQEKPKEDLPF